MHRGVALACPRCEVPLFARSHFVRADLEPLELDACPSCAGVWLDGAEVALALPALAHHAFRHADLRAAGAIWGGGIGACPRCHAEAIAVPWFQATLGLCSACHGMWLEGRDAEAVLADRSGSDGLPAANASTARGGYREAPAAAAPVAPFGAPAATSTCVRCGSAVERRAALLCADGPICVPCAADAEARELLGDDA